MAENSFDEVLLDREVCISLTKGEINNLSDVTPHNKNLHLLLKLKNQPDSAKEILLQITDEQDPLLLFTSILSENDYPQLKSSQKLLVDFATFPHHFCNLIKTCLEEQTKNSPKFNLILKFCENNPFNNNAGSASDEKVFLEVIEVNVFKHLCHLSICLIPASQQRKLTHLVTYIKNLKINLTLEKQKSRQEKHILEEEVHILKNKLCQKQEETEILREELQQKLSKESDKYVNLLSRHKSEVLRVQSDADRKFNREKKSIENYYRGQLQDVAAKNNSLMKKINIFSNAKENLEKSCGDLKQKYKQNEDELKRLREEVKKFGKINAKLENEMGILATTIQDSEKQREHLHADVQQKESLIKKIEHDLSIIKYEKSVLQNDHDAAQAKIVKREASCQQLFIDLNKSLDIIRKLQSKNKEDQMKLLENVNTCKELEKIIEEKKNDLKTSQEVAARIPALETDIKNISDKLKDAETLISEQNNSIKLKESSIAWMNRRLNELEGNEAMMKKAPIAEAYISHQSRSLFHSTPLNGSSGNQDFGNKAGLRYMSDVKIPEVHEEDETSKHIDLEGNKENFADGLPDKYCEPVRRGKPFPVRGLLRKNAVLATKEGIGEHSTAIPAVPRLFNNQKISARGCGQKKVTLTKSSSYFNT